LKNSYQYNHTPDVTKLPSLNIAYPDLLDLFEEILHDGTSLRVRVTGRSMVPFLRGGERLIIAQLPCNSLRKGDLILFRNRHGFPVLHRITRIKRAKDGSLSFLAKGDALRTFDEEISGTSVLGRVRRIERTLSPGKAGYVDMDSLLNRSMNSLIAYKGILKVQAYQFYGWLARKRDHLNSESAGI
jgi:signal peptidase I